VARRTGLLLGGAAYGLWGFLPLYLRMLEPAGPVEVIAHRVLWSLVVCLAVVWATGRAGELGVMLRDRRMLGTLALSGSLLTVNWLVFVYAIASGQLVDGSLGYFINPLVTVALAVGLLHERLRPLQWAALGVAGSAVVVISVGYRRVPWIALVLACSFALYGYIEKRVGHRVSAVTALSVETLAMAPLAGAYLGWLAYSGAQHFTGHGAGHTLALVGVGAVTAAPLLLFNGAARRLPLSVLGMLQYMCPMLQFLTAVVVFHEPMRPVRWIGFFLVWMALVILSSDALTAARRNPRAVRRS